METASSINIEVIEADVDDVTYGLVEHSFMGDKIYYSGSKVDVLLFFLAMLAKDAES